MRVVTGAVAAVGACAVAAVAAFKTAAWLDVPSAEAGGYNTRGRRVVLTGTAAVSKMYLLGRHEVTMDGAVETMHAALRDESIGVLSVANHNSVLDDPVLIAAMTPPDVLSDPAKMRIVLSAEEICFKRSLLAAYFQLGNALPVVRGGGLRQASLRVAADVLVRGGWVHIFPEGKGVQNVPLGELRFGAADIAVTAATAVAAAEDHSQKLVVIPYYHRGMQVVKPIGKLPAWTATRVHVIVGEPIPLALDVDDPRPRRERVAELMADIQLALDSLANQMEAVYPFADAQAQMPN